MIYKSKCTPPGRKNATCLLFGQMYFRILKTCTFLELHPREVVIIYSPELVPSGLDKSHCILYHRQALSGSQFPLLFFPSLPLPSDLPLPSCLPFPSLPPFLSSYLSFRQQSCILSLFWKLDIWNQGVSVRQSSLLGLLGESFLGFS